MRIYILSAIACSILLFGCASNKLQLLENSISQKSASKSELPEHTIYIAGGLGTIKDTTEIQTFELLKKHLSKATENSTLIFTGDNIGATKNQTIADRRLLDQQLDISKNYKGSTYFLHGDNEWKTMDSDEIAKIGSYLKHGKNINPQENCALEQIKINKNLDLILVNSAWFISDWNKVKNINKGCKEIVTPNMFMHQLENYINDAQGGNILIAMHHPVFGNGKYSGASTLGSQLIPLPILGTVVSGIKSLGGVSSRYTSSFKYNYFRILMTFLAQESDRITFVSGHEKSLQYLMGENGTLQLISGALGTTHETKRSTNSISTFGGSLSYKGIFTHAKNGFARLDYFSDGSSKVTFITGDKSTSLNMLTPLSREKPPANFDIPKSDSLRTSIVKDSEILKKSTAYKFFWGKRYRDVFTTKVNAPIGLLDTLYGGLNFKKKGGGHQSYTLRLQDKEGKQYAMRSLDKNPLRILKYNMFGAAYQLEAFKGTAIEAIVYDFFTTSNPYMLAPISKLAEVAKVNHATSELFYIPKQPELGGYNTIYGDGLYFIEERPSKEWANNPGYTRSLPNVPGKITDFISTTEMMEKLRRDESYSIDERSFVRARLFDMLIGDWDRHGDQYRWAEYDAGKRDKRFVVVPRDRDNAFPLYDGIGVPVLQGFIPLIRSWQNYDPQIKNLKWLNDKGNILDQVLVTKSGSLLWLEEAKTMQRHISDTDIEKAFKTLPKELQNEMASTIKANFKQRLADLHKYAEQYGDYLNKRIILHASDKDDNIQIHRLPEGKTKVVIKRNLENSANENYFERTFQANATKEIWIYGLEDDDLFQVHGEGDHEIFVRLIGGYGKDAFTINNTKSLKVYDNTYEEITFEEKIPKKQLTNLYETNLFHWQQFEESYNTFIPNLGFRTDDGLSIGGTDTYTVNGFNGNPFRQQHRLSAKFYPSFTAVELDYKSVWANAFPMVNFELQGYFTNNKFVNNYFGMGNETVNLEDDLDIDFYRARIGRSKLSTGLSYQTLRVSLFYERYKVQEMEDRFFTPQNINPDVFDAQNYLGGEVELYYKNEDSDSYPTRSFYASLEGGFKGNTKLSQNKFGYTKGKIAMARKLIPSGNLVLSTKVEAGANFGNNFFFYHGQALGGNNGLRGFRDERFTGKRYFYQSSDLRLRIKRIPTSLVPITFGLFGGFDYGRVWMGTDNSNVWHTSQGAGLWLGGLNNFGLRLGYFNSVEGNFLQTSIILGF